MNTILITVIVAFVIALILGILLGFFKKLFYVPVDEKVEKVREALPGANCGGCGYPGCDGFAAAVAAGEAPVDGCAAGGVDTAKAVGAIMGQEVTAEPKVSVLRCRGIKAATVARGTYNGIKSCAAAHQAVNGTKMCQYGCVGFGDCVEACQFDALVIGEDGIPHVNYENCTGCGMCVKTCPMNLFILVPESRKGAVALCANRTQNKPSILKNCKNGCIKCGKCERNCPEQCLKLVDGIPEIDYAKCTSCGTCVTGCPTHVLTLTENIVEK